MTDAQRSLLEKARQAARNAYAPYSGFRVGAAVLAGGTVYTGVNVENACYGLGLCAERSALAAAVTAGEHQVTGVAVACPDAVGEDPSATTPCGACRQWLAELAPGAWVVTESGVYTPEDLLPHAFGLNG
ncbi:cytidine deaminase [Desulfohalovibrio reitneri]|uniref:cytidine deaminase n=1 Tax=Desulfohalovibrio reitneri TaxID=1307759 RepID=UPI0004A71798|nr:cytidine deaminase [Desulfohalovibrio reitneri]